MKTNEELKTLFLENASMGAMSSLQLAMLDEAVELYMSGNVSSGGSPTDTLIFAFRQLEATMQGAIEGLLASQSDADSITLDYRGKKFDIRKDGSVVAI